jgi:hypothetical protein
MARVIGPGGRVAITDIVVPEGSDGDFQDRVERVRDPSHTSTLSAAKFREIAHNLGLRIVSEHTHENRHNFDVWMGNAGKAPDDPVYAEVRKLMVRGLDDDQSGFRPRRSAKIPNGLEFMHTVLLVVAEKLG